MRYFVFYATNSLSIFETEDQMLAFLNGLAGNADLRFNVIHGNEVKIEPASVVTQFKVKRP
jgi:hypothetical protein